MRGDNGSSSGMVRSRYFEGGSGNWKMLSNDDESDTGHVLDECRGVVY